MVPLADLAQQVLHRHLAIGQDQRAGGRSADAELVLLRAHREAGRVALDEERGELLAVDLGEDREHVGEAAVGDPHLFAVQDVVLAVGRKHRARAAVHGVGSRRRFRERIGADPFAGRQLGQILLLLRLGAVPDDGQRADADVRAERHGEAGKLAHRFGDDGGRHLVHFQAAVGLGNVHRHQSQFAGLAQQAAGHREILGFDLGRRPASLRWW